MPVFSHLHVHTQFSLLDGAAQISDLYKKAIKDGMPAIAITDHGNMFGAFQFVAEAYKHRRNPDDPNDKSLKVKPIVGCEFYLVENRHQKQFTKDNRDKRYHQLFLAKNEIGYRNLSKLCSLGYIEGLYSKWPRIDKELVLKYHEGLIATTCCLGAEVPQAIMNQGEKEAEKIFKWWLDIFGEDYYIELQRHNLPEQIKVNEVLIGFAQKYGVKMIASNDSHYVDQEDANAHDILLCVNTGDMQATPKATDEESGRGYRFGFPNDEFYFKTQKEMGMLFPDLPEALDNTNEIVDKVELLSLEKQIALPNFPIPPGFKDDFDYLKHLTYEGAKKRYREITPDVDERLRFELFTIETMGFAGYFLVVSDFIKAGKEMGVYVGPGRGSAAGSAVAYCLEITNIDPIKYNLLFERFLNPERKSLPDIDTDFDDEGRQKVIDYVVQKYGKQQVAHIITYGSMAAKMSIKDVARVLDLPLAEANGLAKLVPDKPGIKLDRVLHAPLSGEKSLVEKEQLVKEDLEAVEKLREAYAGSDLKARVLHEAEKLEGSVRNTGIHAAGIIIAPSDLTEILPMATSKETELLITQFDGNVVEAAGVIKMDFLGLKTLSIMKDAVEMIRKNHGVTIDVDALPLDDVQTFELFQRGETNAIFQFESAGMQKYLKELKPDKLDDLIAMNALYRPGPLQYIPSFIARKHGQESVSYDLPVMEEYLSETYGVTVYQEQVMLLSQKLAGFSKGEADNLRKAMGKKQIAVLNKLKPQFIEQAKAKGHPQDKLEKIWSDWEKFASYAFNKSHSTCYAIVAYQTAYLKAHYPAEFMASVLTHTKGNIDKITFFMEECQRMGIPVLGPDINESGTLFVANTRGQLRFGLSGIKGLGEAAIDLVLEERAKNGPFSGVFNLTKRVNLRAVNKKSLEALVWSGGFDCFEGTHRAQYFAPSDKYETLIEHAIRYGNACQEAELSNQMSLFGGADQTDIPEPAMPDVEPWPLVYKLEKEKEIIGIYLSAHPLDEFKLEVKHFTTCPLAEIERFKDRQVRVAGIVIRANHRINQRGAGYGFFTLQDYNGELQVELFKDNYLKFRHYFEEGQMLMLEGRLQDKYNGEGTMFQVDRVQHLEEASQNLIKGITVYLPVQQLNEELLSDMSAWFGSSKGPHQVKVVIGDTDEKITLPFISQNGGVTVNYTLTKSLEDRALNFKLF
jgi:DNA polymerase III subunit alpha